MPRTEDRQAGSGSAAAGPLPAAPPAAGPSLTREQLREYRRSFAITGLGSATIAIGLAVVLAPMAPSGIVG